MKFGYVCYFKEGYVMRRSIKELEYKGITDYLTTSRFDSIFCIINKVQRVGNVINIEDETLEKIK